MNEQVEIIPFDDPLLSHFKELNVAWLKKYFYVEPIDEEIFAHPRQYILDKGGYIFFARYGNKIVGTCALMKSGNGDFELAKMAVDEKFQGKKIGHKLLEASMEKAKELRLSKLMLYSNTKLEPAIHLYRKFGFVEVPIDTTGYKRSNIKMEKDLRINAPLQKQEDLTPGQEVKSRIKKLFEDKKEKVLNVYCTAGYPQLNSTLEVMKALQQNGADLIELGMPYSDPLADGPVIQASGAQALKNGMTISKLFEQLSDFRMKIDVPVVLMGYLNPLLQYGFEKFCAKAASVGIDGLILPDIPMYEFENEYSVIIKKYGLDFIFLVTPETSDERIKKLDSLSTGFLYAVSSSSITGSDKDFSPVETYLQKLKNMDLKNPVLVGFGIKDKKTFDTACKYANGAIIGSAYIKALDGAGDIKEKTKNFLESILK
jgi:tryptophan synthase alpha chain